MAEVQPSTNSGQTTQRFIEFVMMQAQQTALFLGRVPHPQTGKTEIHLDAAKLFIDHLEMIREKTRGNLSNEETEILAGILSDLQLGFVQATKAAAAPAVEEPSAPGEASPPSDDESKKKFTKSYGE